MQQSVGSCRLKVVTAAQMADDAGDALLRVVEQLGLLLTEAGLPRMAARVFAYILAEDHSRYTARELADGLRVSPAAISGAVRLLVQAGLLSKGREPGERSDHYRIYDDDVWAAISTQRLPLLERWEQAMGEAARQLPADSRGQRRLLETQAYYRFMREAFPDIIDRWRRDKDRLVAEFIAELDGQTR
jgi:DNA-binding transcriptional regulator GbsR (MarR family)